MTDLKKLRDIMRRMGESKMVVNDDGDVYVVLSLDEFERVAALTPGAPSASIADETPVVEPINVPAAELVEAPTPETSIAAIEQIMGLGHESERKQEKSDLGEEWIEQELDEAASSPAAQPKLPEVSSDDSTQTVVDDLASSEPSSPEAGFHYEKPSEVSSNKYFEEPL